MSAVLAVLTPSTMNYEAVGRGGVPELTRAEMAALLGGLSRPAMLYAMAKYCDDVDAFRDLQIHCVQKAAGFAVEHGWRTQKGRPRIISLGVLAAIESVNPYLCFACNSLGMVGNKRCSCGNQRTRISHADRAEYVDVCREHWRKVWCDRYERLFNYCQVLDGQVLHSVRVN